MSELGALRDSVSLWRSTLTTEDVSASTSSSVRSGLQARCGPRLEQRTESAEKDAMLSSVRVATERTATVIVTTTRKSPRELSHPEPPDQVTEVGIAQMPFQSPSPTVRSVRKDGAVASFLNTNSPPHTSELLLPLQVGVQVVPLALLETALVPGDCSPSAFRRSWHSREHVMRGSLGTEYRLGPRELEL